MKRLVLVTLFFFVCSFVHPQQSHAELSLAVLAAATVGATFLAAGGTQYALNNNSSFSFDGSNLVRPVVVYNQIALAGVQHALGYTAASTLNLAEAFSSKLYSNYSNLALFINDYFSGPGDSGSLDGLNIDCSSLGISVCPSDYIASLTFYSSSPTGGWVNTEAGLAYEAAYLEANNFPHFNANHTQYYTLTDRRVVSNVIWYTQTTYVAVVQPGDVTPIGLPDTLSNDQARDLAQSLAQAVPNNPALKNDLDNLIIDHPVLLNVPQPITPADLQSWANEYASNSQQQLIDTLQALVNANPTDTTLQAELAKAQADQAQQDAENAEETPPEPSYDLPSSWYTKNCDLSKGLASCIDYQQVINASAAFQGTALYQIPNLILDCLGYVEGDGCEYPPVLTVDFHNRFSDKPIEIDLSPFESVVRVMKFFFSILCIIGTGKAVMALFN